MQYYAPKAVNGMNITWAADGTFTTDADQTETIEVGYFSPATGNWSCITLTVRDTSIIDSDAEKKRKNRRQSQVYQYYLNKNWKDRFQG